MVLEVKSYTDVEMAEGGLGEVETGRKEKRQKREPVRLGREFKAKVSKPSLYSTDND